ncbi:hypothetical protein GWK47_042869 [Chionoecetes opilio]|uniref:Uncharacterized protein n=1 Tax=Chionoecetes opilio TaxID=41210 RepID=A0A8J4Y9W3_CHIOP|nr:hypothetical protein GWK47_042869 [Chionoecetes opilio]
MGLPFCHSPRLGSDGALGSLIFAAEVTPRGRLRLCSLVRMVNAAVPVKPRSMLRPVPPPAFSLMGTWLVGGRFNRVSQWLPPPPMIFVMQDTSDVGRGYQSSVGRQDFGEWSVEEWSLHIIVRELLVPLLFLRSIPVPQGTALCWDGHHGRSPLFCSQAKPFLSPSVCLRSSYREWGSNGPPHLSRLQGALVK